LRFDRAVHRNDPCTVEIETSVRIGEPDDFLRRRALFEERFAYGVLPNTVDAAQ